MTFSIIFGGASVIGTANAAAANDYFAPCQGRASSSPACKDAQSTSTAKNPIITIIKTAINVVSYIAGAAAIISILVNSIRFITANGNEESIAGAKRGLVYSAIGIVVIIIAQSIVSFALKKY